MLFPYRLPARGCGFGRRPRLFQSGNLVFSRELGLGIGIAVVRSDVRFYSLFFFGGWSKKRVTKNVLRTDASQG